MTISTARHHVLLNEQTTVAQKVFEAVPMQEAWPCHQIHGALQRTTRTTMDYKTFQGCLNTLKEAGLVHEPKMGFFERVKPREPMAKTNVSPMNVSPINASRSGEPERERPAAVEVLYELSNRARALSLDLAAAASMIGEEIEQNAASAQKLSQLQSILKGLA